MFNHQKIEKKWQKKWEEERIYNAKDFSKKPKFYGLIEFPYPSGEGLHVGHIRSNTAMDIICRKRRMDGYNVLYPIGWDAFGLPTENYAIKKGIHPKIVTKKNTDNFKKQLKSLGFSFDWEREINTSEPDYYKWTQWIFLQFYKHGLAYKKKMPINWCPFCKIGLANEEVVNGCCERCGGLVEKKEKEQWLLRITKYADKLLKGLKEVDFLEKIKVQQTNWIGKSEGVEINFEIKNHKLKIKVFTTRPDTLFGATYLVLAPESEIVFQLSDKILNWKEVKKYIAIAKRKSDLQRTDLIKEKTGIELKGIKAVNPATKKEIPIWIADYVLSSYGTGAIMAVPAHDKRDFEFAKKFKLPIVKVIEPILMYVANPTAKANAAVSQLAIESEFWEGDGELINSGKFNGMDSQKAKWEIIKFVGGKKQTQYHLRDWIFSRQHYWGEPIPIIFCEKCGEVPVSEKDLPIKLPNIKNYKPTDTGESPLAVIKKWVNVKCPKCGGKAKRETDTMPNWAGSSWYFLRYLDPKNNKKLADFKKMKYWMPVDWYNGGMEHTTLHLLYSRFWNNFLYDIGFAPTKEPYKKRTSQGMILGEGGEKMSKSKGNVINPDFIIKEFGADVIRLYEMFMGPFDQAINWDNKGLGGCSRFLGKIWNIAEKNNISNKFKNPDLEKSLHQTIKKVSNDIEMMNFNTAVSNLMIFINKCYKLKDIPQSIWENFLKILAPFSPFITEELWSRLDSKSGIRDSKESGEKLGHKKSIHLEKWPEYNLKLTEKEKFEMIIQINGKMRDKTSVMVNISQKEAEKIAFSQKKIENWIKNKKIKKIIFIPNRLINIVL
ncbi:leucine--tRNA ligase [Candidatus Wolfebacteria bacterium]|nr:leucine--tRNA ligase [Candidatus Wolfebacteria bacterium]